LAEIARRGNRKRRAVRKVICSITPYLFDRTSYAN
jgi:hypothetical protein